MAFPANDRPWWFVLLPAGVQSLVQVGRQLIGRRSCGRSRRLLLPELAPERAQERVARRAAEEARAPYRRVRLFSLRSRSSFPLRFDRCGCAHDDGVSSQRLSRHGSRVDASRQAFLAMLPSALAKWGCGVAAAPRALELVRGAMHEHASAQSMRARVQHARRCASMCAESCARKFAEVFGSRPQPVAARGVV